MDDAQQHQNDFALILLSQGYINATAKGDDQLQVHSTVNTSLPLDLNARYNLPSRDASGLGGTKGPWGTGEEADSQVILSYYIDNTAGYESLRGANRWEGGETISGDYAIPKWWLMDAIYFASKDGRQNFWDAVVLPTWNARTLPSVSGSSSSITAKDITTGLPAPVDLSVSTLHGRFLVSVDYTQDGIVKHATAYPSSQIPGGMTCQFWFFGPENLEVSVKMLGPDIHGKWWTVTSSLSSLEFVVNVADQKKGVAWAWTNQKDHFASHADFSAFTD